MLYGIIRYYTIYDIVRYYTILYGIIPGEWDPRSLLDPRDRPEQGDCGFYNFYNCTMMMKVQVMMRQRGAIF